MRLYSLVIALTWTGLIMAASQRAHTVGFADLSTGAAAWSLAIWILGLVGIRSGYAGLVRRNLDRDRLLAALAAGEERYRRFYAFSTAASHQVDGDGRIVSVNTAWLQLFGYRKDDVLGRLLGDFLDPANSETVREGLAEGAAANGPPLRGVRFRRQDGTVLPLTVERYRPLPADGDSSSVYWVMHDEQGRWNRWSPPRDSGPAVSLDQDVPVAFDDLFDREEIQKLQDQLARAMGVASVITRPDGTPITRASGFAPQCAGLMRRTESGQCHCLKPNALMGSPAPEGFVMFPCLSGGLWDAGVSMVVGGRHVANWLVGQVWSDQQDETQMRAYARSIGADEEAFVADFDQVPRMTREHFDCIAQTLFTLARQLSDRAFQNLQQAQFIAERNRAENDLRLGEEQFRETIEHSGAGYFRLDHDGRFEAVNAAWLRMHGFTSSAQIVGRHFSVVQVEADLAAATALLHHALRGEETPAGEATRRLVDGSVGHHSYSMHPVRRDGQVVAVEGFLVDRTALQRAVADYKMLFDTMLDGFALHEILCDSAGRPVDYRFVAVNSAFERQIGRQASELVGRTVLEVMPATESCWIDTYGRVAQTGEPVTFESHSRSLNRYFSISAFRPSAGRFACVVVDITARKLAELELRKLSRAVEQSPVMVLITDVKGVIEYINPAFTAITGYVLDDVRGQTPRVLGSGETSPERYRELWRSISAGREWRGEFHNRRKNGELFWEAATIGPIFGDDGRITHYLAVKEDITERKRAAGRISEQAALLDVTQDAILVAHLDRTVTYWNRGAAVMYDIPGDAAGRRYEELIYREPAADWADQWGLMVAQGSWTGECRQVIRSGRTIDVRMRSTVIAEASGAVTSVLLVISDITDSKRLEAQLLRAQRLESLGALASGVAHDLNNVLTPILMSVEMLRPLARAQHDHDILQLLSDSARRGADVVQQLLLFGRGSDSPRAPLNLSATVREVGRMMRETFPKNIVLTVQAPADLRLVEADRTQMHQLVLNLCVNARDAMPVGGRLTLQVENVQVEPAFARNHGGKRPGDHVRIQVRDTGTGIAPAHLEKIFDPFFTTKPAGEGTGLGLATVLGIARSHGGMVDVESTVGCGTTFGIYLPVVAMPAKPAPAEAGQPQRCGHDEQILLVEDEEGIRLTLQHALTSHNYRVLVASDGAEALGIFAQRVTTIGLVITDMMMPVMDGLQTLRALRRLKPDLPAVAISGLPAQRIDLGKCPGPRIRFLSKPFTADHALKIVREALDEGITTGVGPTGAAIEH